MKNLILFISLIFFLNTFGQAKEKKRQEEITEQYSNHCAKLYNYNFQMTEWQNCLDEGLKMDPTNAQLWQQKAMPYFKCKKYEVGMEFIDKAVLYDKEEWLPYRAFIKCVFAKTYQDAIADFQECIKLYGNGYRMDHSYNFYIGLSYLQLNEYEKAQKLFQEYVDEMYKNRQQLEHPTALFYLGIAEYELKRYNEAIVQFDKALKIYPQFSDVKYYKAICLYKLGKMELVDELIKQSKENFKNGYTINEDNTIYETYPYQKKWEN
jgi:tetratricopeptide (TPR) repeat protein